MKMNSVYKYMTLSATAAMVLAAGSAAQAQSIDYGS